MQNIKNSVSKYWNIFLSFFLFMFTFNSNICLGGTVSHGGGTPAPSVPAPTTPIGGTTDTSGLSDMMCTIVELLTGSLGQAVAMIALVALGIGIFLGKLSWPLALATAVGITFIFSAGSIIGWLTTGTAAC